MKNTVDMREFMSRHDLVWKRLPRVWYEAPFIANGFFGCTAWFKGDNKTLVLALGHTSVYDNRELTYRGDDTLIKTPRLPVGNAEITFDGEITDIDMRLDIYDAEVRGRICTTKGECEFSLKSLNDADCIVFAHTEKDEVLEIAYKPVSAVSPRVVALRKTGENQFTDYADPRTPYSENNIYCKTFVQPYFNGGGFCVAERETAGEYLVALAYDDVNEKGALKKAEGIIEKVMNEKRSLCEAHKEWWNSFYKKSFLSWNDGFYESFYYIQLYKLACASRENGAPFDTCGPWLSDSTRWPGTWWNLNVELTVSPLYTSNHIEIAKCVSNALKNGFGKLIENVPEKYRADCVALGRTTEHDLYAPVCEPGDLGHENWMREAGNLVWALFYCYTEYRMTGDRALITETVYPLLKRAVQYYLYFLYKGADGRLHLKATLSPEYIKSDSDDVNYDLSLLKWGLLKLIELNMEFCFNDEKADEWQYTLENLTDFPQADGEGMKIAGETPYAESHRHYSHILAFYPLHVLDRDNAADRKLVDETINFWQSKPEALLGYSQTGAASMRAMLRDGNAALSHLDRLMNGFVQPNTMYHEDGNPVIETPPSAATAILEMFLQSHDGYIDFFPAVPNKWRNVCFDKLLCEGGFEVGAELCGGKLKWLKITSLNGSPCRFKADFAETEPTADKPYNYENGLYTANLAKGESITLAVECETCVHAVDVDRINCFGLV